MSAFLALRSASPSGTFSLGEEIQARQAAGIIA